MKVLLQMLKLLKIDSNPPANLITKFHNNRIKKNKFKTTYNSLLSEINYKIQNGLYNIELLSLRRSKKRSLESSFLYKYLAARKLRKRGFNVKTITKEFLITYIDLYDGSQYKLAVPKMEYNTYIIISWK